VQALRARPGLTPDCPALRAVGYRAIWRYLEGELDHAAMVTLAVNGTAQYAKRQYTWFRQEAAREWLDGATTTARETLLQALR
jgi:tRNA dimethylallyltransferase